MKREKHGKQNRKEEEEETGGGNTGRREEAAEDSTAPEKADGSSEAVMGRGEEEDDGTDASSYASSEEGEGRGDAKVVAEVDAKKKTASGETGTAASKSSKSFASKLAKRGVIYISRIPPGMNPAKMKSLLSDFGPVTRIYLAEEDASTRKRRRKAGGHGGKRYVEGWAEFEDRNVAWHVGKVVNNTPMTNNKRSRYQGDTWNVKYLGKKFTWNHLTEKVSYERRMREQKLMVEMMQARRENAAYAELIEEGRRLDKMDQKRRRQAEKRTGQQDMGRINDDKQQQPKRRRPNIRQKAPVREADRTASKAVLSSLV